MHPIKVKVLHYLAPLYWTVSVVLYNLTPGRDSSNLGASHHLEVIKADGQLTSYAG